MNEGLLLQSLISVLFIIHLLSITNLEILFLTLVSNGPLICGTIVLSKECIIMASTYNNKGCFKASIAYYVGMRIDIFGLIDISGYSLMFFYVGDLDMTTNRVVA